MDALDVDTIELPPREQRINLAIFDYHARVDRGEMLDPRLWLEENAEIADELRAYLEDLSGISIATSVDPTTRQFQVGEILGDYHLLEKIAEGGAGHRLEGKSVPILRGRRRDQNDERAVAQ